MKVRFIDAAKKDFPSSAFAKFSASARAAISPSRAAPPAGGERKTWRCSPMCALPSRCPTGHTGVRA
jgi:hypothetical protein